MAKTRSTGHVRLNELFCRQSNFRQVKLPTGDSGSRQRIGTPDELNLGIKLNVFEREENRADVDLSVRIEPDDKGKQPYEVTVTYRGRFELGDLPAGLKWESFVQQNAAAIMFPFVREAIGSLTSRGAYGPLWLPPINVVAMLEDSRARSAEEKKSAPPG